MSNVTYKIEKIDAELGHLTVTFDNGKKQYTTTFCDIPLEGDAEGSKLELERRAHGWAEGEKASKVDVSPELKALIGKTETVPEVE